MLLMHQKIPMIKIEKTLEKNIDKFGKIRYNESDDFV